MAGNYTEHYQLSQWQPQDRVLRTEFNQDNARLDAAIRAAVPAGTIALWSGAASAVPTGWALCDGQNGTPDLRGRFVVGAGGEAYAVGDTGGAATEELSAYSHTGGSVFGTFYAYDAVSHDNRPPFYALCFIMKL